MNGKSVFHELCDFLDGELDTGTVEEIKLHLDRCQDCRLLVDTTKKTIELYCDGELFPLPSPVRDRLHEMLRNKCQNQTP